MNRQSSPLVSPSTLHGRRRFGSILTAVLICSVPLASYGASTGDDATGWKAGLASTVITPEEPLWMAGYAARNRPSEGKVHDLHAKALALEDSQGGRLVIVTVELLGVSRATRDWLAEQVGARYQLSPERLLINASHTHCGPVTHQASYSVYGDTLYGLSPEQVQRSTHYLAMLHDKLLELVGRALDDLAPARLSYSHARAGFAMNRRLETERGYQILPNPDGPVDHDVPVLRVDGADGGLRAVLFGYACHCTTLDFYEFCGDYAGFAQEAIRTRILDAVNAAFNTAWSTDGPWPTPWRPLWRPANDRWQGRSAQRSIRRCSSSPRPPRASSSRPRPNRATGMSAATRRCCWRSWNEPERSRPPIPISYRSSSSGMI